MAGPDHIVISEAVEVHRASIASPRVVLTVEHASNRLPEGWTWPDADHRLKDDHWAYDLGIATLGRELSGALGAPLVMSRFSRLLIDPNRPLDAPTLFRDEADGQAVWLNTALTEADRRARIARYYDPYHDAVDQVVASHPGAYVLSLHSFTPRYEGQRRDVEIGVLFDHDEAFGRWWYDRLATTRFDVRLNEPWSGRQGLMYSAQQHAEDHGRRAVELEIRYDLLLDAHTRAEILQHLTTVARDAAHHLSETTVRGRRGR